MENHCLRVGVQRGQRSRANTKAARPIETRIRIGVGGEEGRKWEDGDEEGGERMISPDERA